MSDELEPGNQQTGPPTVDTDHLTGPKSAKNALSNAYQAVHRGDEEGAKLWIERAEDRIEAYTDGGQP